MIDVMTDYKTDLAMCFIHINMKIDLTLLMSYMINLKINIETVDSTDMVNSYDMMNL